MNFNVNKCKRLHIEPTNLHNKYTIAGIESDHERDLGVIVDNKLKFHIQTAHIVNKGFSVLGIIKKRFENLDEYTEQLDLYMVLMKSRMRNDYRKKRGDIIQTSKIMRGFDRIDPVVFFKFLPSQVT